MLWCEKRHLVWWAGPQMYDLMLVSTPAGGFPCVLVTLVNLWDFEHCQ